MKGKNNVFIISPPKLTPNSIQIARSLKLMYVHAYQSYIWNMVVSIRMRLPNAQRPLVGDFVAAPESQSTTDEPGKTEDAALEGDAEQERVRNVSRDWCLYFKSFLCNMTDELVSTRSTSSLRKRMPSVSQRQTLYCQYPATRSSTRAQWSSTTSR